MCVDYRATKLFLIRDKVIYIFQCLNEHYKFIKIKISQCKYIK